MRIARLCVGIAIASVVYALLFVLPHSVPLSYGLQQTCMPWLTVFPSAHRTVDDSRFTVYTENDVRLGGFSVAATKICVAPTSSPAEGKESVAFSPFGGWILKQNFSVETPKAPTLRVASFSKPVPVNRPLAIAIDKLDFINKYSLYADGSKVGCSMAPANKSIECDIRLLNLKQGSKYDVVIKRSFKEGPQVEVLKGTINTLTATTIVDSSIKVSETVYSRPTEVTIVTDKPLKDARVTIVPDGDTKSVPVNVGVTKAVITVKLEKELERGKAYKLVVTNLQAIDGSSLVTPYEIPFYVSGGPKVTGVSVGGAGVGQWARVVVSFDRPAVEPCVRVVEPPERHANQIRAVLLQEREQLRILIGLTLEHLGRAGLFFLQRGVRRFLRAGRRFQG